MDKDSEEFAIWKAEMTAQMQKQAAYATQERAEALLAVQKALATYRWWGWTNIVNTVRMWFRARRYLREGR